MVSQGGDSFTKISLTNTMPIMKIYIYESIKAIIDLPISNFWKVIQVY